MFYLTRQFIFSLFFVLSSLSIHSQEKFKVVLDAGHGGKDSGAHKNGVKEKDIVLDVVLKVGDILDNYTDIQQIYTRKTDVFIELKERSAIANKANADLFVSIHCNSYTSASPYGALTLVMGQARANMNLEIAKTENSVIFLEDNYKQNYKGFDPNNPASMIGLKILQEESQNRSIEVASNLQKIFKTELGRKDKGVHQQPIWVLDATVMPGILIEMGYISNASEAKYLKSEKGKNEMAQAIAKAIIEYKNEYFSVSEVPSITLQKPEPVSIDTLKPEPQNNPTDIGKTVYKVQLQASEKPIAITTKHFKGLNPLTISSVQEGKWYKYYFGETSSLTEAQKNRELAQKKGFKSAFVVTFKDSKKIN